MLCIGGHHDHPAESLRLVDLYLLRRCGRLEVQRVIGGSVLVRAVVEGVRHTVHSSWSGLLPILAGSGSPGPRIVAARDHRARSLIAHLAYVGISSPFRLGAATGNEPE